MVSELPNYKPTRNVNNHSDLNSNQSKLDKLNDLKTQSNSANDKRSHKSHSHITVRNDLRQNLSVDEFKTDPIHTYTAFQKTSFV